MTATRRTAKRRTACAACLLGLAASATAQAPSVSDVSKVLGNSNTLNGGVLSLRPFNVQFLANSSHAVISLTIAKPLASIGYAAIGTGNSMASADMLVMWPYSGQWYASHRTVDVGHNPPQEASVPSSSDLAYSSALSSNSSTSTTVSFVRALKPAYSTTASAGSAFNLNAVNGMIYAYSSTNPGTSNTAEADLSRHDNNMYGVTSIDLSQSVAVAVASSSSSSSSPTATSTGGATSSAQTSGTSTQSAATQLATQTPSFTSEGVDGAYTNILVAHGIVGAITWAIVSPGMVMLATYGRQWSSWIRMHKWVQLVGTVALTAVTVALASVAVNKNGGVHLKGGHQVTGIVLLILLVVQIAYGLLIHHLYNPQRTKKPIRNVGHIILGVALTVLGFAQVGTGLNEYKESTGYSIHPALWAIYGLIFGGVVASWLMAAARSLLRRKRQNVSLLSEKNTATSSPLSTHSPPGDVEKEEPIRVSFGDKN